MVTPMVSRRIHQGQLVNKDRGADLKVCTL